MKIFGGICSSADIVNFVEDNLHGEVPRYVLLHADGALHIDLPDSAVERMLRIMGETGASMVYSDYRFKSDEGVESRCCIDYQFGSVRDDFDFGPVVMIDGFRFRNISESLRADSLSYSGWYKMRLMLSTMGPIVHIPEFLYDACSATDSESDSEAEHFAYVNPRNRGVQIEMEQVFTGYLRNIGAWMGPRKAIDGFAGEFPVEASVIIPVRNRVNTIGDAIFSALEQKPGFEFNVIVVDNHSTDGTTEVINRLSDDPRLIHIIPESTSLGIGGCWNLALADRRCGRFAIQLDSDDIYNSDQTIGKVVECFRREGCAMVVGSYSLTDFNLNPLPPGVIDHREWTDENGHNNLLRVNGLGAPRAFFTGVARQFPMPDVSYGEDYAMGLRISRSYRIGRIFDVLYLCRRWEGNSDSSLSREKANRFNTYKDRLRSWEIAARLSKK